MNDIVHAASLEFAQFRHTDLLRDAERARMISQATGKPGFKAIRIVRDHIGRAIVLTGRRIQGCSSKPALEEANPTPALRLAR